MDENQRTGGKKQTTCFYKRQVKIVFLYAFEKNKKILIFEKKDLTNKIGYGIILTFRSDVRSRESRFRWCGSMAEQLICNQQVDGSTPFTSSKVHTVDFHMGDFPSGQRGQTVNLLLFSFGGPNPPSPTRKKHTFVCQDNVCFFQRNSPSASEIWLRHVK